MARAGAGQFSVKDDVTARTPQPQVTRAGANKRAFFSAKTKLFSLPFQNNNGKISVREGRNNLKDVRACVRPLPGRAKHLLLLLLLKERQKEIVS